MIVAAEGTPTETIIVCQFTGKCIQIERNFIKDQDNDPNTLPLQRRLHRG